MVADSIRPASTVCLLRRGATGLEVLMVRRATESVFVGGAHVFPGGAVDDADRSEAARRAVVGPPTEELLPWMAAALREVAEEAGVLLVVPQAEPPVAKAVCAEEGEAFYRATVAAGLRLDAGRLGYLSNWVTPAGGPRRFDTRFFVAAVGPDTRAEADGVEVTEASWVTPAEALARFEHRQWELIFPTLKHLELLGGYSDPARVVAFARGQAEVPRIEPRPVVENGEVRFLLPGEPGYEEIP